MKNLLKLEELAKWILSWLLTMYLGFKWWMFFAWLLVPDISMIGYLINTRVGAILYNIGHHQAIAIAVIIAGYYSQNANLTFASLVLFGHSSMDRVFGYGLKYSDDFKNTHLGRL